MKAEQSDLVLPCLAEMSLLYVKQSFQLIFALFTVEITNDTSVCQPVDTTVYLLNSPISFSAASDSAGLFGREMLTLIQTDKCDTASYLILVNIVSLY